MLSISANVLVLSVRRQRLAVCLVQADLVSLDVDGQFGALTVGVGDALPVAVLKTGFGHFLPAAPAFAQIVQIPSRHDLLGQ